MKNEVKFKEYMTLLCELHDRVLSDMMKDLYWKILEPFTDEQCEKAFKEIIYSSRFFPKPADFKEVLCGKVKNVATMRWIDVFNAVGRVGHYASVKFADPVIHSVINAMGGWPQLCMMTNDEAKWKQKEFERLYEVISEREGKHPDYLPGESEMTNTPEQIAMYKERTGKSFKYEIVKIGFDESKMKLLNQGEIMPDTYREGTYEGKPTFSVLTGINMKTEQEYWFSFGMKKAQAILENIDALRRWVDKNEK